MTYPIIWCADATSAGNQAALDTAGGRRPAARGIHAVIGRTQTNTAKIKADIEACAKDGAVPLLWMGPDFADLDAGIIDFATLPDHPSVAAVAALIGDYGQPCPVRICFECANRKQDKTLRYGSPATFRTLFDAIVSRLPANAIPVWSWGANGWPTVFADWRPASAKVADLSLYGRAGLLADNTTGKNVAAFTQVVKAVGLPLIVGESGLAAKDYPAGLDGETARKHIKALLAWCLGNDVRLLAGPFNQDSFGCVPWAHLAEPVALWKKALAAGTLLSLPLAQPAAASPLLASGLVQP